MSLPSTSPSASPDAPTFQSLGLSADTLRSLERAGFTQPTPIQARAIPPALEGRDVIGCAATGTGKTAAFVLPLLERLIKAPGARALVLAPTRELALQITEQVERFGSTRGFTCATFIGGVGMQSQIQSAKHARVLIATPGRLIDHLQQGTVRLDAVAHLVLDEADRMLDMGFKPQLTRVLARVPRARQTMLFSATMAGEVAEFARANLRNPVRVEVTPSGTTASRADQRIFLVPQQEKTATLLALLADDEASTLVFTRTKHRADRVARQLERAGHAVARIHGDRSQSQRENALEGFRNYKYRILVATDIAARGIDVADIGHVVNYDLPNVPEDYVHRVGRTARASAKGRASSFASPEELPLLRDIERLVRTTITRAPVPRESSAFQGEVTKAEQPAQQHGSPGQKPQQHGNRHGKHSNQSKSHGHGGNKSHGQGGNKSRGHGGSKSRGQAGQGGASRVIQAIAGESGGAQGKRVSLFRGGPKRR